MEGHLKDFRRSYLKRRPCALFSSTPESMCLLQRASSPRLVRSTSGIMYNLIKKIPFVAVGPRGSEDAGKLLLYIAHPHMQLGAEGIAAGTAFLLVSMCMLGVTGASLQVSVCFRQ